MRERAVKVVRGNASKTPSKPLRRISTYQWGLGKSTQKRSKRRSPSNTESGLYEGKVICEADKKHVERMVKINGLPADFMTLTCSTYHRHFRARIGLVNHQRTL